MEFQLLTCSTINLAKRPIAHGRTKHTDIRFHLVKSENQENMNLELRSMLALVSVGYLVIREKFQIMNSHISN